MEFRLLGAVELVDDRGRRVPLRPGRQTALFALLVLHANELVPSEVLVDELWGESPPATARNMLHNHIAQLRSLLQPESRLETVGTGYRLSVGEGERDVDRFEERITIARSRLATDPEAAAREFREALTLWRGSALADVAYERFAQTEAARLEERRLAALEGWAEAELALGRHADLVAPLEDAIAAEPLRERLYGLLMLALYRSGRQSDALDLYRRIRNLLVEEMGVEPGPELRGLHQAILMQDAELESPASPEPRPSRLATPLTRTIGRDADRERVASLVRRRDVRLLTLVGPAGVGKTRLALEVARLAEPDFPDGAWFVALAPTADAEHIPSAVARALDLPPSRGETPRHAVLAFLHRKHALLVLDNFEHLLAGAPLVSELLASCRGLTVLATSRAPLRVEPERRYAVEPLAIPATGSPAAVAAAAAGSLFVERAQSHDPGFALSEATAGAVADICRRVDGLPLAIELAAARVPMLGVQELSQRLATAMDVLGRGPRDAPARQRTLRLTLDWSHQLLTTEEADAFAAFGVFAGGATLDAAEAITGVGIDVLEGLVEKQLLRRAPHTRPSRLLMLETVREYARERLAASGKGEEIHRHHCEYYVGVAAEVSPDLVTDNEARAVRVIDTELNNLRAAFDFGVRQGDSAVALKLAGLTREYWEMRGLTHEGLSWANAALGVAGEDAHAADRAAAGLARIFHLTNKGAVYDAEGLLAETRTQAEEVLAWSREAGDPAAIAEALLELADLDGAESLPQQRRRALSQQAVAYAREAGDQRLEGIALRNAALSLPLEEALPELERAAAMLRGVGARRRLLGLYSSAAYNAIKGNRPELALPLLDEVFPIVRELDDPLAMVGPWGNIGLAALLLGDVGRARMAFENELRLSGELRLGWLVAEALMGLAGIAANTGAPERAARLLGAAASFGSGGDADVAGLMEERFFAEARMRLGDERWRSAEAEGARLSLDEAVELGLIGDAVADRISEALPAD